MFNTNGRNKTNRKFNKFGIGRGGFGAPFGAEYPPSCSRDYLVQYTLAKYLTEYESATYLIDKLRGVTTGIPDGRVGQRGAYFDGDGSRYVDIDEQNLGTSHYINIKCTMPSDFRAVATGTLNTCGIYFVGGDTFRYRSTAGINYQITSTFTSNIIYEFEVIREGTELSFYVNKTKIGPTQTVPITEELDIDTMFANPTGAISYFGKCPLLDLNGYCFDFGETNTDTTVYGVSEDGTFITGEIQNATGSDRVQTDDVESQADLSGYAVSKALGKNLFDKSVAVDGSYYFSDGSIISSSSFYASALMYIEGLESITVSNKAAGGAYDCFFDEDGVFISSDNINSVMAVPKGAIYFGYSLRKSTQDIETAQVEEGTVPTAYEAYIGMFSDSALTNPVPQGTPLPVRNNLVSTWISDGLGGSYQPRYSEIGGFSGPLRGDIRIVDGVVDLVSEEDDFTTNSCGYSDLSYKEITVTSTASVSNAFVSTGTIIATNTEKLCVCTAQDISGTDVPTIKVRNSDGSLLYDKQIITTETRFLFTPTDGGYQVRFLATVGASELASKRYYDFAVYEASQFTSPLTDPLPTTSQPVTGNSLIQATTKYSLVQADALLNGGTGLWYDHSDPDNVVANVLAVADLLGTVYNKQHFVAIEEWIQTFYSQPLDISCVEKVELFLKMLEQVFVVEGAVLAGTDKTYVLKDEVNQL